MAVAAIAATGLGRVKPAATDTTGRALGLEAVAPAPRLRVVGLAVAAVATEHC